MVLALGAVLSALACVSPDCDRPDHGTCGVACCALNISFPHTSTFSLMTMLNSSIAKGGPDFRFILRPTAENKYGFADFRSFGIPVHFMGQAWHETAKYTYKDTINYLIYAPPANSPNSSVMRVHSISQIGGAYGDDGQNYKNIVVLVKALGIEYTELSAVGCPAVSEA